MHDNLSLIKCTFETLDTILFSLSITLEIVVRWGNHIYIYALGLIAIDRKMEVRWFALCGQRSFHCHLAIKSSGNIPERYALSYNTAIVRLPIYHASKHI